MIELSLRKNNEEVMKYFLTKEQTTIGRATENVVVVDDAFASNEHARISRVGSQWWLEDLNSRNGTLLNEAPLESPAVVTSGDQITVGRTTFELELMVSQ